MSQAEKILKQQQAQERREREDKPKAQSYWGRCEAFGCPLQSSIKANRKTCSYHFGMDGEPASAMTEAIKEKQQLLVKLSLISEWTVYDWKKQRPGLMGWETLPLGENELPTVYINRFREWVNEQIDEKADELLRGR